MKTQRARLYDAIYAKWAELDIDSFEAWLAGLGITWVELDSEITDAPAGTVAVWEGPGFESEERKQCWAVPEAAVAQVLEGGGVHRRKLIVEVQIEVDAPIGSDIDCEIIAKRVQDYVFVSMHDIQEFNPDTTVVRARVVK